MVLFSVIAYFLGGIPFGYLVGKLLHHRDIRKEGSGNTGTTNAFRTMGALSGILTLLCDCCKGVLACLLMQYVAGRPDAVVLAGVLAVFGHCFSPFLRFRGGKGVATSAGVLLCIDARMVLILAIVFVVLFLLTGIVSLGSVTMACLAPCLFLLIGAPLWTLVGVFVMALIVIVRHHANIARLRRGKEHSFLWR